MKLYKRAQILIADLWACFEGQGPGMFNDIDSITMFADYRFVRFMLLCCLTHAAHLLSYGLVTVR